MRVAYLTSRYPAPSHTFIRREVEALRRRGVEVCTFSIRQPPRAECTHPADANALETTSYVLPMRPARFLRAHVTGVARHPLRYLSTLRRSIGHRVPGLRGIAWSLFYFGEAIVLARELERSGVRHVHNHFADGAANVGHLAAMYLGLGWSLTLHGLADFDYPSRLLLREKARVARFVVCISHYGRAQALMLLEPSEWHKLVVARCGVTVSAYAGPREPGAERTRILTVGRLAPEKGQWGLLEAFEGLIRRGLDAELRLIGDGPLRTELEARSRELGIGDRCTFAGHRTEAEVATELRRSDIVVLSSFMEGLPVVLMEALASGVAVVAPRVAGVPELVEHEKTGLLFTPSRWDELEEGLARLVRDESLRRELGLEGRKRVTAEFDVDKAIEPLLAKLAEVVA